MIRKQNLFLAFFLISLITSNAQLITPTEVRNIDMNSPYAEIGVKFISDDLVLFASSKKNETTGKREKRNNRHMGLQLYTGSFTEYGSIIEPKLFQPIEDNPIFESNITFSADLKTVYFTRNNDILDNYTTFLKRIVRVNKQILKMFRASINDSGQLSNISPMPFNSDNYSVTNPHLSLDGRKLYFVSDMKGSLGGFDIYAVDIQKDGTFSAPKNLGNKINSEEDEFFPFVDKNDILYFSSNGHKGFGELDVFSSSLSDDAEKPVNLGAPINSKEDDFSLVFNVERNIGYFSSTRSGGFGNADIYVFKGGILKDQESDKLVAEDSNQNSLLKSDEFENSDNSNQLNQGNTKTDFENIENNSTELNNTLFTSFVALNKLNDDEEECTQLVEGFILNSKNIILVDATVTLYENGVNVGTYKISPEGKYKFELKCKNHYRIAAKLNKFEETYFDLRTSELDNSKTITNITLEKTPCDVFLTGQLTDKNTELPIVNAKIYLINKDSQIKATATNSSGIYSFKVDCEENYKINTDKYGYEDGLFNFKSGSNNSVVALNSAITRLKCRQIVNGKITNLIDGNEIIGAKVELINSKGILVQSVGANTNGNFHFNIDCSEKYTLRVSNDNYITATSKFKSNEIDRQIQRLDFALTSNICKQTITGTVINFKSNKFMSNVIVDLVKDNSILSSVKTNELGFFEFYVDCNENYEVATRKSNYFPEFKSVVTNNINNNKSELILSLESKLDFEIVRNQKMILTGDIDFELNQSEIREDAAIELNKITSAMSKNKNINVFIGVHTDSRAPDNYNLTLSKERAQSIVTFIISKGINKKRLSAEGHGETKLLNGCSNGVKCSESEHLINRRIEFIVNE